MEPYLALYRAVPAIRMLLAKVTPERFAEALAQTTVLTYLSRLCPEKYNAMQYGQLSSVAPIAWRTLGRATGVMAQEFEWPTSFTANILSALPGILIMTYLMHCFPSGLPPRIAAHAASRHGPRCQPG